MNSTAALKLKDELQQQAETYLDGRLEAERAAIRDHVANEIKVAIAEASIEVRAHNEAFLDRKFESEKALVRDYIGTGIKIAAFGLAAALVTVGFFGWKSYDDVNKFVQAEILKRFEKDPIREYEELLNEAALRAIISALSLNQLDDNQPDDLYISHLVKALHDPKVELDIKDRIITFATSDVGANYSQELARSSRKLLLTDFSDNREAGISLFLKVIQLYAREPEGYVPDILNVLDKFENDLALEQEVAKSLLNFDVESGAKASRLLDRISKSNDSVVQFYVKLFNLRTSKETVFDKSYFVSILREDANQPIDVNDLIFALSRIPAENSHFWELLSTVAGELRSRGMTLRHAIYPGVSPAMRFAARRAGVVDARDKVDLIFIESVSFFPSVLPTKQYEELVTNLGQSFVQRNGLKRPTKEDLMTMEFYLFKSNAGAAKKPYFLYSGYSKLSDNSGTVIAADRRGPVAITLDNQDPNGVQTKIYWKDNSGILHNRVIDGLNDFEEDVDFNFLPSDILLEDSL